MPIKFFAFSILLVPFFVVGSCLLGGADLEKKKRFNSSCQGFTRL